MMNKIFTIFLSVLIALLVLSPDIQAVNTAPIAKNDAIFIVEDTSNVLIDVLANDSDPDGDLLLISILKTRNGQAVLSSGKIKYSPYPNFSGIDTVTYQICDNGVPSLCKTALVIITITPKNDIPIATDDEGTTNPGVSVNVNVIKNDSDIDKDNLTISIASPPLKGTATVISATSIKYTPNGGFTSGTDQLIYEICDNGTPKLCSYGVLKITVPSINLAPVVSDENVWLDEDGQISVNVLSNDYDPNNNTLTLLILNPGGKAVITSPGVITYKPINDFNGLDVITYVVCDNATPALCSTGALNLNVNPVNDAPIANPDHITIIEDATNLNIDVLQNDTDTDGDPLFTKIIKAPTKGIANALPNGQINYKPNLNYFGLDQFIYEACDATAGLCDTSIVYINLTPVNDPPKTKSQTYSINEDDSTSFNILFNDIDPDGDPLTVTLYNNPSKGKASVNANGTVSYKPNPNFFGSDVVYLSVCDTEYCTIDTLNITVLPINDRPIANRDFRTINEDSPPLTFNVKSNDIDPDGDLLSISIKTNPFMGTASVNLSGNILYTPNLNIHGLDSLQYEICDAALCSTAYLVINIKSINDAPIANTDYYTTNEDFPGTINVQTNDSDIDLDYLVTTIISGPSNGISTVSNNKNITYFPNVNYNGQDVIIYQICDTTGTPLCDTAKIFITILAINDPPVANSEHKAIPEDVVNVSMNVLTNDYDPEGNPITVNIKQNPGNGTVVSITGGVVVYTPNPNFNGIDYIVYEVCDNFNLCDTAKLFFDVSPVNDKPIAIHDYYTTLEDFPGNIPVLSNDIDGDGDPLQITIIQQPSNGTIKLSAGTNITYTPNADYFGTDSFIYEACDNANPQLCDTAIVKIVITPINDKPRANSESISILEDSGPTSVNVLLNDYDPENEPIALTIKTNPTNGTITVTAGLITYTPNLNFNGTDFVIYEVCDSNGSCDTAKFTIYVQAVNDAPIANSDNYSNYEDNPSFITIGSNDSDVDGNALTYTILVKPSFGTANLSGSNLNYFPNQDFFGKDFLIYQVCDDGNPSLCDTAILNIQILPVNDAPIANTDHINTNEDTPITYNTRTNDKDVDGDVLTTSIVANPSNGSVTVNANGDIVYTPSANYFGNDSFIYRICDPSSKCDTAIVFIKINSVNDAPIANSDYITILEDSPKASHNVLNNDTDVDGSLFTVTIITPPASGTASVNTSGAIEYKPSINFNGNVVIVYQICDKGSPVLCDTAKLFINVTPVNDAPLANTNHFQLNEDAPNTNLNVLSNDSDVDGDPLTVTIISGPANGIASVNASNTIKFKPKANFSGSDLIIYQICDNGSPQLCDTAKIFINISAINDAPTAKTDHKTITEDSGPVNVNVLTNDKDVETGTLTVKITQQPKNGIAVVNSSGNIIYTPKKDFYGIDSLIYSACDKETPPLCDTAWLIINVTPVNDAPTANTDHITIPEDSPAKTIDVISNDSDIENNTFVVSVILISPNCTVFISNSKIVYKPNANFNGMDTVIYQICDNGSPSKCDTSMLIVNVTPINDKPKAVTDTLKISNELPGKINVSTNDSDIDKDGLSYTINQSPKYGTASITTAGILTYTANTGFEGSDTLYYEVCDKGIPKLCVLGKVIIIVKINKAPIAINDTVHTENNIPVLIYSSKNDSDPENDKLTYKVYSDPQNGTVTIQTNGKFLYRPTSGFSGIDYFDYEVCDINPNSKCSIARVFIKVGEAPLVPQAYNGFSPNSDGINDNWYINGIDQFPENEVHVFNRWGSVVWSTENYNNSSNAWMGNSMSGDELPDGTYYYVIKFDSTNQQKGWVIIKR